MIELVRDLRAINVLAKFENDLWKFTDVRALKVIFHVKLENAKKIAEIFFGDYDKTRNLYWLTCLDLPTKFGDFSLKNEFRKVKRRRLIKWSIMCIFNEAEPPWSNLSETLGQ